tara:strand:- start:435 stop:1097 length:663 start_codon:yes stop_codon:yes gene_type:complete
MNNKKMNEEIDSNIEYEKKIEIFFLNDLKKIQNPNVIEFGVRKGVSTKKIIKICEQNQGFLHAVDNEDCSNVSSSSRWKFHLCRDDNFEYLDEIFKFDVDLIYLDSFHEANHIEKIFYHYYPLLKVGGLFVFDDISWLPYLKNKKRNNFNCEINNQEIFNRILEIKSENDSLFDLYFSFIGSGSAKIIKNNSNYLKKPKKIYSRKNSTKNILRRIIYSFK